MPNESIRHNREDAELNETDACPAAATTAVNGTSLDLGATPAQDARLASCELEIGSPAFTTTMLPDTRSMTYKEQYSADDTTVNDVAADVLIVTGAAAAGAVAVKERFKLPSTIRRYIRIVATTGASTGNCAAVSFTTKLLT